MNIESIKSGIATAAGTAWGCVKHNSPIILTVAGIAGIGVGVVLACKATTKVDEAVNETAKELHNLHSMKELVGTEVAAVSDEGGEENVTVLYSKSDYAKDVIVAYRNTLWRFTKLYGISTLVLFASVSAIIFSYSIQSHRLEGAITACALTDRMFSQYRDRVVEKYGEDEDNRLYFGTHEETVEEIVLDADGNPKTNKNGEVKTKSVVKEVLNDTPAIFSLPLTRETSALCNGNVSYIRNIVELAQRHVQSEVVLEGYCLLHDVLKVLECDQKLKSPELEESYRQLLAMSHSAGWIFDPDNRIEGKHSSFVNFGLTDDFDTNPVLIFNCEPTILNCIPEVYKAYTREERSKYYEQMTKGFKAKPSVVIDGELVE